MLGPRGLRKICPWKLHQKTKKHTKYSKKLPNVFRSGGVYSGRLILINLVAMSRTNPWIKQARCTRRLPLSKYGSIFMVTDPLNIHFTKHNVLKYDNAIYIRVSVSIWIQRCLTCLCINILNQIKTNQKFC